MAKAGFGHLLGAPLVAVLVLSPAIAVSQETGASAPASFEAAEAALKAQVRVDVLTAGKAGEKPPEHSYVLINYKGMLKDGTVFDQAEGIPMSLDEVVPGFAYGLVKMERGGRYRMTIPPELGYGANPSGPIPANSTLVFEVDLIDFKTPEEFQAMIAEMQAYAAGAGEAEAPSEDSAQAQ